MFSSTTEYALRAVVYLALQREGLSNSQVIAQATKVPAKYLSKVLKDLARAGLVFSQRGPNGGFRLARDPGAISVLEVVNAVDPIQRIRTCPLGLPEHATQLCRLHQKLDDTIRAVEETLRSASINDMTQPAGPGGQAVFPTIRGQKKL